MFDLQVLALETDMTRIISFKTGRDAQNRVFPESGSNQPFHPTSHHGDREERILEFNKINKYRVGQVPYLLDRLKASMEGDSNLLEKTMVVWGSPMADPNVHNHRRCPLIAARPRQRRAQGQPAHQGRRRHADGQRVPDAGARARHGRHQVVWRQHGRAVAHAGVAPSTVAA